MIKKDSIFRAILGSEQVTQILELVEGLTKEQLLEQSHGTLIKALYQEEILDSICNNLIFLKCQSYHKILAEKLSYEFGNSPSSSSLFVQLFLPEVIDILKEKDIDFETNKDGPVERILSLLVLKVPTSEIRQETSASEHYINLLKRDYLAFERFISRWEIKNITELKDRREHCDLSDEKLFFLWEFYIKLHEDKNFFLRLEVDRLIRKANLGIARKTFFGLLKMFHSLAGMRSAQITRILAGTADELEIEQQQLPDYGLLASKNTEEIKAIINRLIEADIISLSSYQVYLTSKGIELLIRAYLGEFIHTLMEILGSDKEDKIETAGKFFLKLDSRISQRVIEEITKKKNRDFLEMLQDIQNKVDENLLLKIIWAYGEIEDIRATKLLLDILKEGAAPQIRAQAYLALGRLGDRHALGGLILGLTDHSEEVKIAAIKGLVSLKDLQAIPYLDKLASKAHQEKEEIKKAAKKAIGLLKKIGVKVL